MHSQTEENYLKAIFKLLEKGEKRSHQCHRIVCWNGPGFRYGYAEKIGGRNWFVMKNTGGVTLSVSGKKWRSILSVNTGYEYFLVEKFGYLGSGSWYCDGQQSTLNLNPNQQVGQLFGKSAGRSHMVIQYRMNMWFHTQNTIPLSVASINSSVIITGVIDHRPVFLRF